MLINDILMVVIQLAEVELTTWSIMLKSRPSGQTSGRVGSFLCFEKIHGYFVEKNGYLWYKI